MQSYTYMYFVQSKFALTDEDPHFLINVPHTHIPDVIILCEFHKVQPPLSACSDETLCPTLQIKHITFSWVGVLE